METNNHTINRQKVGLDKKVTIQKNIGFIIISDIFIFNQTHEF